MDTSSIVVPVYPDRDDNNPVAGQPYFIDCVVDSRILTNADLIWVGPQNTAITATSGRVSGRVSVGDVFQDTGRSVRRITFNPLSTEDSGRYTCVSHLGKGVQTLTVDGGCCNLSSAYLSLLMLSFSQFQDLRLIFRLRHQLLC